MSIYAFILFEITQREIGLSYWKIVRNIVILFYVLGFLLYKISANNKIVISMKRWTSSLIVSVFSWAVGGFVFDLIRVFQIILEKAK